MSRAPWPAALISCLLLLTAACSTAADSVVSSTPGAESATRIPNTSPSSEASPQPEMTLDNPGASSTPPAVSPTETSAPTPQPATETAATLPATEEPGLHIHCNGDMCSYASPYFLKRPIAEPGNDGVDVTYRFGSTQGEMREPHHGVELLNSAGTPVLAAADGLVLVAGDDLEPTSERGVWPITFYGPYSYFYGNLVVIEHEAPAGLLADAAELPQPIFSLYAHLSEVLVEPGEPVVAGQQIGAVGLSGIAEGSHLHFEVRLGENTYDSVRNPELWLAPRADEDGQTLGGIAGRVVDSQGNPVTVTSGIVLQRLPDGPDAPHDLEFYTRAYEEAALIGQPPWEENFGIGDLPAGLYRISFAYHGVKEFLVEVRPGQLSVATLRVE